MDDKELVEVWRKQFENYHGAHARFDNGRYVDPIDQTLWVCWIAAKRSQPSVVLPNNAEINHLMKCLSWTVIHKKEC